MTHFEKISSDTGIACWRIKLAMGITLNECMAKTLDDAALTTLKSELYSESEYMALLKWDELAISQIEEARNLSQLVEIKDHLPAEGVSKKMLIKKMMLIAKTPGELLLAYNCAQKGSTEEKEAFLLLVAQANKELLIDVYFKTALDHSLSQLLIKKIVSFY